MYSYCVMGTCSVGFGIGLGNGVLRDLEGLGASDLWYIVYPLMVWSWEKAERACIGSFWSWVWMESWSEGVLHVRYFFTASAQNRGDIKVYFLQVYQGIITSSWAFSYVKDMIKPSEQADPSPTASCAEPLRPECPAPSTRCLESP